MHTYKIKVSYQMGARHVPSAVFHIKADTMVAAKAKAHKYATAHGMSKLKIIGGNSIKENVDLTEAKMSEIHAFLGNNLDKHIGEFKRIGGTEVLANKAVTAATKLRKEHNIPIEHASKMVASYIDSELNSKEVSEGTTSLSPGAAALTQEKEKKRLSNIKTNYDDIRNMASEVKKQQEKKDAEARAAERKKLGLPPDNSMNEAFIQMPYYHKVVGANPGKNYRELAQHYGPEETKTHIDGLKKEKDDLIKKHKSFKVAMLHDNAIRGLSAGLKKIEK